MNSHIKAWGRLCGISDARDRSDLFGLFQWFRPNGAGVEAVFRGLPAGDEVLARVMRCYACTAHELWKSEAYFIPRPAQACNESAARILLRSHIEELKRLARRLQSNDYPEIFANFRFVRVDSAEELRADSNDLDRPDVEISDLVSDYFCTISAQDNPIRHLRDAFYSIACDETIARYLQWPIYEASAGIHDPFLPAFELWSKGVEFSFPGPGVCKYRLTSIDGA